MVLNFPLSRRHLMMSAASLVTLAVVACGGNGDTARFEAGAVASSDSYSAKAAEAMLAAGGNAVDAAVATAFTLAVTYPEAGNIGGGGFMTMYVGGKSYFLDYRETAPAAATATMYTKFKDDKGIQDPVSSLRGAQAVAVPGTVRGLWEAQKRFGKLSWQKVMEPSISLAESGYTAAKTSVGWRDFMESVFGSAPYPTNLKQYFGSMKTGETFKQPELAATLKRISANGADEFYSGQTADLLVAAMTQDGGQGIITKSDLRDYKVVWRDPLSFSWNGQQVVTAPPPSSGGIALGQLLKMKGGLKDTLFKSEPVNSAQYIHLTAEMMKRVFADRAAFLGDPDFVQVPVAGLMDDSYVAARAKEVDPINITPTASVKPGSPKFHTTHFSVVDKWGNAVANTFTLNMPFGSGVIVKGAGFALNDEMDDFSTVPNQPNIFGVVGTDANAVAPGKRPLSSMAPTILVKDGLPTTVIGSPGGPRIFTAVYQVLTNVYDHGMPIGAAVANRRFHHQLPQGNDIEGEPFSPIPSDLSTQLKARGYNVTTNWYDTDVQAIQVLNNVPLPVSDPRGHGLSLVVR
jgi:gamma-glutamyltranspeptidase/glutathione hydrolase